MTDVNVTVSDETTRVVTTDDQPPVTVIVTGQAVRVASVAEQGPQGPPGTSTPAPAGAFFEVVFSGTGGPIASTGFTPGGPVVLHAVDLTGFTKFRYVTHSSAFATQGNSDATVGIQASPDGGSTWTMADGAPLPTLPVADVNHVDGGHPDGQDGFYDVRAYAPLDPGVAVDVLLRLVFANGDDNPDNYAGVAGFAVQFKAD
jgi:hypothetical protein